MEEGPRVQMKTYRYLRQSRYLHGSMENPTGEIRGSEDMADWHERRADAEGKPKKGTISCSLGWEMYRTDMGGTKAVDPTGQKFQGSRIPRREKEIKCKLIMVTGSMWGFAAV